MKRRAFFTTAMSGAAAWQAACQYVPAAPALATPPEFELDEVSLADLATGLQQGKWTSEHLVQLYLERINAIDGNDARRGPQLGAVLALNPDAAAIASQLDQDRKNNRLRGPLHGTSV
jgi:amidase